MNIRLVAATAPTEVLQDDNITDVQEFIAFCARVSNPANQYNTQTSEKLLGYLKRNKHWSPFEMANVVLEIETTRDIARQMLRHRSFSIQEFSQRYADGSSLGFELREARLQDQKNRQNSIETNDPSLQRQWDLFQRDVWNSAKTAYDWAVSQGIAKEVARAVLPEGMTMSRMYVNGTIRSWIHYIDVRTDPTTQKEHRELAKAIADAISQLFPVINTLPSPTTADEK